MRTIRGVFDGKEIRPLSDDDLPHARREVPVLITFLDEEPGDRTRPASVVQAARRLRGAREAMAPLDTSVRDLIEAGREC